MIDPFRRGMAWYKYKRLESDFINATSYFPFEKEHKEIWSEYFSDLIVRIGNSVDSFFRIMLKDESFASFQHVASMRRRRRRDINYFRDFFEPIYVLSGVKVQVAYGLTFYERDCCPFKEFKNNRIPDWWNAYNHVKHEWFDRIQEATLKNTIEALAGLFILNILHKESQRYLIWHTQIINFQYQPRGEMEKHLMKSMIGKPKGFANWEVFAATPLFTHNFRLDESIEADEIYDYAEENTG